MQVFGKDAEAAVQKLFKQQTIDYAANISPVNSIQLLPVYVTTVPAVNHSVEPSFL